MRKVTGIIVHCTATRANWWHGHRTSEKVAEIKRWHLAQGWSDIGYHYLIDRDGTVAKGRDVARTGAHVKGHNTGTIGISLFGGHGSTETDQFEDNFTPEQNEALMRLIGQLHAKYGRVPVTGHNQYAAKACPGFNVPSYMKGGKPALSTHVGAPKASKETPAQKHWLAAFIAAIGSLFTEKRS
ncbi:MAG: N-acetylmuramoyl-L-alanine amidase [Sulfitobacter sp.]